MNSGRRPRLFLLGLSAFALTQGCYSVPLARQPRRGTEPVPGPAPIATAVPPEGTVPTATGRIEIRQIEGSTSDAMGGLVGGAHDQLEACGPSGAKGFVTLHISGDAGGTTIDVRPVPGLSREGQRCYLETLSTIDVDQIFNCTGPRPANFSSLITVRW